MTRPRWVAGWVCLLWLASAAASAHAQTLSTADLAGTWAFVQLAPPLGGVNASTLRSYSGQVTFGADGAAVGGTVTDDQANSRTVTSGGLTVAANGHVSGSLGFDGLPQDDFLVSDARLLTNRHAIVGAATFFDEATLFSRVGLFNLVKLETGQSFTINVALAGSWTYHELDPVDQSLPSGAGTASWSRGLLTFHTDDATPGQSCTEANLVRSDGSVRATSSGGFGCAALGAAGAVTGTNASVNGQMTTSATLGERDLILGLTDGADTQFPGMVALTKIAAGVTFAPADLAGSWSVYLQRVDAGPSGGTTAQFGQVTFSATGAFAGGSLSQIPTGSTGFAPAPTSTVAVASNGSVTATLVAIGTTMPPPVQYRLRGVVRATKDVITGVLTVQAPTQASYGLVTLVRDATLFDLSQPAYAVTEGNSLKATVLRSGSLAGTAGVTWTATGAPGQLTGATTGVLTFPANSASQMFTVTTAPNTAVDGNRSVTLTLSNPTGASALLGTRPSAPLTIVDEDRAGTFRLSAAAYTVAETVKNAPITIQRVAGSGAASGIVVTFALNAGTAVAGQDYTLPANNSVTFATGAASLTVQVPILENALVDGSRTFTFTITSVSAGGTIGSPASATVTIGDNDVGGSVQFSGAAYTVNELVASNTSAPITVTRTGGAAGGVLVDFTTADGTAQAGQHYTAASGTLTFDSTNTSKTFAVPILANGSIEGDTTILLSLGNVRSTTGFTGAGSPTLGALTKAVLTIKDAQKGLQFSSANYSVKEALTTATVSVVRTGPLTDTATVRYSTGDAAGADAAIAGVNYTPASGVLTFGPNVATQSFGVKILLDKVVTGPKTVLLLLSGANSSAAPPAALGRRSSAVLTIANTDVGGTVAFGSAKFAGTEGGAAVVSVTRTGGAAAVSVDYATSDQPCAVPPCAGLAQADLDYTATAGTLKFAPGDTSKTILVPLLTDSLVEGDETFLITLGNVQGGAAPGTPSQAVVTIADKNQGGVIQLGTAAYSATAPPSGNVSVPVMLTRTGSSLGQANVLLMTGAGTAVAGVHYLPVATTVVFGDGQTSRLVPIVVLPDDTVTGNLTVPILLSNPSVGATLGATRSAVLTIVDAESSVRFSAPAYAVTEGGTATITVLRGGSTAGTATVTVTGDGTPNVDYKPFTGTLSFASGAASAMLKISTLATVATGTNRSVTLTLQNPSAGYATGGPATLTIQDKDGPGTFQFASSTYNVTEGAAVVTVTVTRTGGTGGSVSVPWMTNASAPTDFTPISGTLTFTAGLASKTFTIAAVNNMVLDGSRPFVLTLGTPSGGTLGDQSTATLNVLDNDNGGVIQFVTVTQVVAENIAGGVVKLALVRTGTNLAGGIQVDYTITGDTFGIGSANGSVTFAAGATTASIPVTVVNALTALPDRHLVVALSNPRSSNGFTGATSPTVGAKSALALTITDALPHVQFSAANYSVVEGTPAMIGITRTGSGTGTVTVNYAAAPGGTAVSGTDYTLTPGTLTVTTGAAKTFPVSTFDDGVLAGSRTVLLSLDSPTGASLGTPSTATLTILDKQSAGTLQFASASASVLEGNVAHVTVTRTGANLVGGVTVDWSVTGGTATGANLVGNVSGTLTFGAGAASQSFDITAADDGVATGTLTVLLSLSPPTGGAALGSPSAMTIYILDQQQSVGFASPTATVGETTASATIQVVRSGVPSGTVTVQVDTVDGPDDGGAKAGFDYTTTSATLTFGPGEIIKPVTIPILTTNAATRNGNRALSVVLSGPTGAALNAANTATLTIMDFRPDLVITSVSAPAGALTGKAVATPSTVKNIGPVAAPPFQIGIFLVRADDPGALLPGAGSLVTVQSVPGLAAGASASFPTQLTLDDQFPPGDYYISAVANFSLSVAESDTSNNGLSSAPTNKITISRSLTKFTSASASFSQTSPAATAARFGVASAGPCDLEGAVDLTGTFGITSQTRNIATGQANLTGTLSGFPVQYLISFTAQLDRDPTADTVTGTLDSVVFKVLGTKFLGTSITGSGNGSFVGSLSNGFEATVTAQFTTSTGGSCVFTGSLSAEGQTSFQLRYSTSAEVGSFGFDPNPAVQFPVRSPAYSAVFKVFIDEDFPDPSTVLFTGPPGSGLNRTPADPVASAPDPNRRRFAYVAPARTGPAPGGVYTVLYKGVPQTFTLPPYNPSASFVVIYPTVTLVDFQMPRIDWVYRSTTGANLSAAPSFITGVTVRLQVQNDGNSQPVSPNLSPSVTSFDFTCGGLCSPPTWSQVESITFQYTDVVGNQYEVVYPKSYVTELGPRLTNTYGADNCGANPACSLVQRLFTFFTGVPAGSVDTTSCAVRKAMAPSEPFFFGVQNQTQAGAPPYGDPTCVDRLGTTILPGTSVVADVFGMRTDLDVPPDGVPYPPGLDVGTQFLFRINRVNGVEEVDVRSVDPSEANRSTDVVFIPNEATPALKPSGFTLADAKLGQAQDLSWTVPPFSISELFIEAVVHTTVNGDGMYCTVQDRRTELDPAATQGSFTLPPTCNGQPVLSASACVVYLGENTRQRSEACWTWR
jgi:hypothetical protein